MPKRRVARWALSRTQQVPLEPAAAGTRALKPCAWPQQPTLSAPGGLASTSLVLYRSTKVWPPPRLLKPTKQAACWLTPCPCSFLHTPSLWRTPLPFGTTPKVRNCPMLECSRPAPLLYFSTSARIDHKVNFAKTLNRYKTLLPRAANPAANLLRILQNQNSPLLPNPTSFFFYFLSSPKSFDSVCGRWLLQFAAPTYRGAGGRHFRC